MRSFYPLNVVEAHCKDAKSGARLESGMDIINKWTDLIVGEYNIEEVHAKYKWIYLIWIAVYNTHLL